MSEREYYQPAPRGDNSIEGRVGSLEHFQGDHARQIGAVVIEVSKHDRRLEKLEEASRAREVADVREEERDKALLLRLDTFEDGFKAFKRSITAPLWSVAAMIGLSLAAALWKFIVVGGLAGFVK